MRTLEPEFPKLSTWTVDGVEAIVGHAVDGTSSNVLGAVVVVVVVLDVHSTTESRLDSSSFSEVLQLMAESLLKFSLFLPLHAVVDTAAALARSCLVRVEDWGPIEGN